MGNALILGLPDLLVNGTAASSSAIVASALAANILTDEPSDVARIASVDPSKTWFNVASLSTSTIYEKAYSFDAYVFVNHNMTVGGQKSPPSGTINSAQVAASFALSAGNPIFEKLPPTGLVSGTNVTGTYTDVDEDVFGTPDANNVTQTVVDTPSVLHLSFGTPFNSITIGAGVQAFYIRFRQNGGAGVSLTASLYESGVSKQACTMVTPAAPSSSSTGAVAIASWDATNLATASGANAEVRISFNGCTIMGVEWQALYLPSYLTDYFRSIQSNNYDALFGNTAASDVGADPTLNSLLMLASRTTLSTSGQYGATFLIRDPNNTAGYVKVGLVRAGPAFRAAVNISPGDLTIVVDNSFRGRTRGGQGYGSQRRRWRKVFIRQIDNLTTAEGWGLYDRLMWRKGLNKPVFVSLYPDDATAQLHTSIWGTVSELTPLASNFTADTVQSMSFAIEEKL